MATICDLKDEAKGLHYFYPGTLFIFLIRGEPGASGRGPRPSPLIEAGRDRRGGGLTAAGNKIYVIRIRVRISRHVPRCRVFGDNVPVSSIRPRFLAPGTTGIQY